MPEDLTGMMEVSDTCYEDTKLLLEENYSEAFEQSHAPEENWSEAFEQGFCHAVKEKWSEAFEQDFCHALEENWSATFDNKGCEEQSLHLVPAEVDKGIDCPQDILCNSIWQSPTVSVPDKRTRNNDRSRKGSWSHKKRATPSHNRCSTPDAEEGGDEDYLMVTEDESHMETATNYLEQHQAMCDYYDMVSKTPTHRERNEIATALCIEKTRVHYWFRCNLRYKKYTPKLKYSAGMTAFMQNFFENVNPSPTRIEKINIARSCRLTTDQVHYWFKDSRRRGLPKKCQVSMH
jgi:hypothetical protein